MVVVYTKQQHKQTQKQGVPLNWINILCLTVYMCYVVVENVQEFSYPVKNRPGKKQAHFSYNKFSCL